MWWRSKHKWSLSEQDFDDLQADMRGVVKMLGRQEEAMRELALAVEQLAKITTTELAAVRSEVRPRDFLIEPLGEHQSEPAQDAPQEPVE